MKGLSNLGLGCEVWAGVRIMRPIVRTPATQNDFLWGSLGFRAVVHIWEFPKMRGTLFWGPFNMDPII